MDITSVLIFQIIADVALCIAVLFLLISIGRKVNKANPRAVDGEHLVEFQKLLGQSQQDAALFFAKLDESFSKFQDLTLQLDEKEERLRA
ncbi:MAG: hypothetical protein L7F78_15590, partial [Syntrophales bacterium LBB04]|nr:hypothetical protein [Syntrophales bacterium LBB04]